MDIIFEYITSLHMYAKSDNVQGLNTYSWMDVNFCFLAGPLHDYFL